MLLFYKDFRLCLLFISLLLISCSKDEDTAKMYSDSAKYFSAIAFYNAIPNSSAVHIFQNSKNEPMKLTSELLAYKDYLPYRNFISGNKKILVDVLNQSDSKSFQQSFTFQPSKVYSIFVIDDNGYKLLLSEDNVIKPIKGKAKIRLAHLSKSIDKLSYRMNNSEMYIAFKEVSDFYELDSSSDYQFKVESKDGISYILNEKLASENIYTLLIVGDRESNDENTKGQLILIKH